VKERGRQARAERKRRAQRSRYDRWRREMSRRREGASGSTPPHGGGHALLLFLHDITAGPGMPMKKARDQWRATRKFRKAKK
jgi:hypothetical protein